MKKGDTTMTNAGDILMAAAMDWCRTRGYRMSDRAEQMAAALRREGRAAIQKIRPDLDDAASIGMYGPAAALLGCELTIAGHRAAASVWEG